MNEDPDEFIPTRESLLSRLRDWNDQGRRAGAQNRRASDDAAKTATIERVPDPAGLDLDAIWDEEWRVNLMKAATERVKMHVSPEQYEMFHLYVIKEMTVLKVATRLGVSAAQIYLAKHRVSRLLKKELRKLEKEGV